MNYRYKRAGLIRNTLLAATVILAVAGVAAPASMPTPASWLEVMWRWAIPLGGLCLSVIAVAIRPDDDPIKRWCTNWY